MKPVSSSGLRGYGETLPQLRTVRLDKNWGAMVVSQLIEVQCPPDHTSHVRKFRKELAWSHRHRTAALP